MPSARAICRSGWRVKAKPPIDFSRKNGFLSRKPMARLTPLHLIPALIAAASHAGEITIEKRPFCVEKSFAAVVLPEGGCLPIQLNSRAWEAYKILTLAEHGCNVVKNEVLICFETQEIDEKITAVQATHATQTLMIAKAALECEQLQAAAPALLQNARRAAETASEENRYFTATRRKAAEEAANQSMKRYEQLLSNQREELKQLTKMYEADEVTENTEEIILVRQQDAVASAEFALRMEMLEHQRMISVNLPREALSLAEDERVANLSLAKAQAEVPRSIELKTLELAALKTAFNQEAQTLAELLEDRKLCEFKAPGEGVFYHGSIENGRWLTADMTKFLQPQATPPTQRALAMFVPKDAKLLLIGHLDEATQRSLKAGLAGVAILAGREEIEIPVALKKMASVPDLEGGYRADFSVTWPAELLPAIGSAAEIRIVAYQQPSSIVVPNKTLAFDPLGWSIEVKLADGKTARRPVKRGRSNKDETEILAGLEEGQVIVVPQ
jgi:HlyD family secretion protein